MEIERIVLAATDMRAMVAFYDEVFGCGLEPLGDPESFHRGDLCGIELVMCPNDIAGVDARQNRHQLRVAVGDVDHLIASAQALGGQVSSDEVADGRRLIGLVDPDGNTYEVVGPLAS